MDLNSIIQLTEVIEERELKEKINSKVKEVIDDIDLNEVKSNPFFNTVLAYALACKAAGIAMPGNIR